MKSKKTKQTKKKETQKPTEIICVIDKSGSMASTKADAIGGFNSFIEEQKKLSKTTLFSAMFFNAPAEKKLFYNGMKIKDVEALDENTYVPGGMTALFDAIGTTIDLVTERHSKMKKAPRTLLMILTDGEENSSTEHSAEQIKKKLDELQNKKDWKVVYVGATADKFTHGQMNNIARNLNISGFGNYAAYTATVNVNDAYSTFTSMSTDFVKDNTDNKNVK